MKSTSKSINESFLFSLRIHWDYSAKIFGFQLDIAKIASERDTWVLGGLKSPTLQPSKTGTSFQKTESAETVTCCNCWGEPKAAHLKTYAKTQADLELRLEV